MKKNISLIAIYSFLSFKTQAIVDLDDSLEVNGYQKVSS